MIDISALKQNLRKKVKDKFKILIFLNPALGPGGVLNQYFGIGEPLRV